jgi:hypothetical protein
MIDVTQFVLIFVVVSLTAVLIIIGYHSIGILKEFKTTVTKINKILDDTGLISESVAKPISVFSGMVLGLRGGPLLSSFINILKRKHSRGNKEEVAL